MTPERGIVRILRADGGLAGHGFLVGDVVVTCAHVVNVAVGREHREGTEPGNEVIHVEFPFGGRRSGEVPVGEGYVDVWFPSRGGFDTHDLATLRLAQGPPEGVLRLLPGRGDQRGSVQMWGPVRGNQLGGHIVGQLLGYADRSRLYVSQEIKGQFRVARGFSGGPVWSQDGGTVVGILQAAGTGETAVDVYVIAVDLLIEILPELAGRAAIPSGSAEYLAHYVRRCAVVDPRHVRRRQVTQDVILPLEDVYIGLALGLNRSDLHELPPNPPSDSGAMSDGSETENVIQHEQLTAIDLVHLVREHRWAVILGVPGAGKSTLLQWLALTHARAIRAGQERAVVRGSTLGLPDDDVDLGPARLPILIRVADYVEHIGQEGGQTQADVYGFLGKHLLLREPLSGSEPERTLMVQEYVRQGRALLLLDGLDEITNRGMRERVRRDIEAFIADHVMDPANPDALHAWNSPERSWWNSRPSAPAESGGNQIIVSSRIHGYDQYSLDGRYTVVQIRPLAAEMIRRFCENWCLAVQRFRARGTNATEDEVQRRASREAEVLYLTIRSQPSVARMATNPLLLTVIGLLQREGSHLPAQRVDIYSEAARVLVERRSSAWTLEDVTDILGPLALWMHENRPTGVVSLTEMRAHIAKAMTRVMDANVDAHVDGFLETARQDSGILIEVAVDHFSFVHLTFQEYFAAKELTRSASAFRSGLASRLRDTRWREVLLLAVAVMSKDHPEEIEDLLDSLLNAGSPHEELLRRDLLFTAECLAEMPRRSPAIVRAVVFRLLSAGAKGDVTGYHLLSTRVRNALRDLFEARPQLVLPHIIDALNEDHVSAMATDVCAELNVVTPDLLNALEAACQRWNRSPRAMAIRAEVARSLRAGGAQVNLAYRPIKELLDEHPAAVSVLTPVRAFSRLLGNIQSRVDLALYRLVRWLLDRAVAEPTPDPEDLVADLIDEALYACGSAEGAEFSSLAGIAYDLAPQRTMQWLKQRFAAGTVDLLSAARFYAELPVALPKPVEEWYSTLPDEAAACLLRQTIVPAQASVFVPLAWQRLRSNDRLFGDALALLRQVGSTKRLEVTLDVLQALKSLSASIDASDRSTASRLMTRLSLPAGASEEIISALDTLASDSEDPLFTIANILLAQLQDKDLDPSRLDVVSEALLKDGELWRDRAQRALQTTRKPERVPIDTLRRAIVHNGRHSDSGDFATAAIHLSVVTAVKETSAEGLLQWVSEMPGAPTPSPSGQAITELIGRLPTLPSEQALAVLNAGWQHHLMGTALGIDLGLLLAGGNDPRLAPEARTYLYAMFSAEATITGGAEAVVAELLERSPQDPDLIAMVIRTCATWLSRSVGNWAAAAGLRDAAHAALHLNRGNPAQAMPLVGALAILDTAEGKTSEHILEALELRSPSAPKLVQSIIWALSGPEWWLAPRTRGGQSLQLNLAGVAARFSEPSKGMRTLLNEANQILPDQTRGWDDRRAVMAALDAAASQHPASFVNEARSVRLHNCLTATTRDPDSYNVRLSSMFLASLLVQDKSYVTRLVGECRDNDWLTETLIARLKDSHLSLAADIEAMTALLTAGNGRGAWLAANVLAQSVRDAKGKGRKDAAAVVDLITATIKSNDLSLDVTQAHGTTGLRRALYELLDELIFEGAGKPATDEKLGKFATESAILQQHLQWRIEPTSITAKSSVLSTVASRVGQLNSDHEASPPPLPAKVQGSEQVEWSDLNLSDVSSAGARVVARVIRDILELRVGIVLAEQMTDRQLAEFEAFIDNDDEAGALAWLNTYFPHYKDIVRSEATKVFDETKASAPEILRCLREQSLQS